MSAQDTTAPVQSSSGLTESERKWVWPSPEACTELAKNPLVKRWLFSRSNNEATQDLYTWWFTAFCLFTKWSPEEILRIKREALKQGEPVSKVEDALRDFYYELTTVPPREGFSRKKKGYSNKSRALALTASYSFLTAHGFSVPRKLIYLDQTTEKEIRVLDTAEVESIVTHAVTREKRAILTVMSECPARPRVFPELQWGWLESDWYKLRVVHVSLPKKFRPKRGGRSLKFEPICYVGPRGIEMLRQLRDQRIKEGRPPTPNARIFLSLTHRVMETTVRVACRRAKKSGALAPRAENEEEITPKSFRKFIFNKIDSLQGISPEWRAMLKGRDLGVEKYYSKENIEALRKIYREKIYPAIWGSAESKKPQTREDLLQFLAENLGEIRKILGEREGADVKQRRAKIKESSSSAEPH